MPRVRNHPGVMLRAELEAKDLSAHQLALALQTAYDLSVIEAEKGRQIEREVVLPLG